MYKNTTEPGLVLPQDTPVETITRTFRSRFTNALDRTGIFKFIAHTHTEDLLVLNYHSILEHQYPQPFRYHHTTGEFAAHLEWLGRNCEPVGLDGVRKWLEGQWTGSKPPALITFDDGYRSSATIAADLLSRKGMPAVFFLSTDYIGRDRVLWPDVLFARILAWTSGTLRLPEGTTATVPEPGERRVALAFRVLQSRKDSPEEQRLEYLEYLAGETPAVDVKLAPEVQDFMSWDDARDLVQRGFELGSHTVTHPILSRVSSQQLRRELVESRKKVEAETGSRCIAIAYPNGSPRDYNPEILQAVEEAGYELGFIVSGRWSRRPVERLAIDRITPPGHASASTFALHASGARSMSNLRSAA
jgi:peptidoglycan/xylan/chitin deacetylase (PgdA/CDA1 family)